MGTPRTGPLAAGGDLLATDIDAYLARHQRKDLLRVLTCGSVDDGKSTLIGRLLHDAGMLYADHLEALQAEVTGDGPPDLASLLDGLQAEREQGITIDVAYRYVSTDRRSFILADTPGHEQYTRNMVTGASTSQVAIILVDARQGVLPQTRRHTYLAALLGIRHVVLAVNKMDLVGWSQDRFDRIVADHATVATAVGLQHVHPIPLSALSGDNVVTPSDHAPWYAGAPLLRHLEEVDVTGDAADLGRVRFPVQLVTRPDADFRGYAGTLRSGVLRPGDEVVALPSGVRSTVDRLVTFDGDLEIAGPGDAITVTLRDHIDLSRGEMLVGVDQPPQHGRELDATVVWMATEPATPGRGVLLQSVTGRVPATLTTIDHRIDVTDDRRVPAERLELNDIARCHIAVDRELHLDPYDLDPATGSFVLVDRLTNATVAAGMLHQLRPGTDDVAATATPRSRNIVRATGHVTADDRRQLLGHGAATVWFTGLSGAGKSTLAAALEQALLQRGVAGYVLDGDDLRFGLNRDLGFAPEDRAENVRRVGEVCRLLQDAGLVVISALISPDRASRDGVRALHPDGRFVEVHVATALEVCEARDVKGLYAEARAGRIPEFTGVSAPYEPPVDPEVVVDTDEVDVDAAVAAVLVALEARGVLPTS